jgi:catechol 2,3-dioxygenase
MTKTSIHPDTTLGHVHLIVSNLDRSLTFYQQALGFKVHRRENDTAYLGAGQADLLVLTERPDARRARGTTGLYHFAILVPSRFELAQSLQRIAQTRTRVEGFADHLVSEAIYLPDPDGNGIEIYRDRPRSEWEYPNGQLKMGTEPLDVDGVLADLAGYTGPWLGLHPDTVLGHIHLHVANIPQAEAFYQEILGFDLILRYGPTASFLSAGGYHHHLGINTWSGTSPSPPDATGLRWYVIQLPSSDEMDRITNNVRHAGLKLEERQNDLFVQDPVGNGILLTVNQHLSGSGK